jgi:hypothetical protein
MNHFEHVIAGRGLEIAGREVFRERTSDSKTFEVSAGKFRLIKCGAPIHYDLDGQLEEIDLTPRSEGDEWVIDKAPFILRLKKKGIVGSYKSRASEVVTSFDHPGNKVADLDEEHGSCRWCWVGETLQKDLSLDLRPAGIDMVTELQGEAADFAIKWRVNNKAAIRGLRAQDKDGNTAEIKSGKFTGRVSKIKDKTTRKRTFSTEVSWPVRIV